MNKITIDRATVEQALKAMEVATTPLAKDRQEVLRAQAAIKEALAEPAQQEPVDHAVIAGALFDFLGWLTSRQQRVTWSSCDDATTAIDAVIEFAKMRGLSLDEVHVLDWQDRIQAEEVLPWPVIDKSAATRIATALGWEPKREWVGLTDEEVLDALHAEFADARWPSTALNAAQIIEAGLKEKNT